METQAGTHARMPQDKQGVLGRTLKLNVGPEAL